MIDTGKNVEEERDLIKQHVGDYIVFGGRGLINGLSHPCKYLGAHKIIAVCPNGDIEIRGYRRKILSILPWYSQNQKFNILTKTEYDKLPVYSS